MTTMVNSHVNFNIRCQVSALAVASVSVEGEGIKTLGRGAFNWDMSTSDVSDT